MAAPYTISDQPDGTFDLSKSTDAGSPPPTSDELGLANAINERIAWVRIHSAKIANPTAFASALRQIAELGLVRDPGRDNTAARQQFSTQFGDLQPAAATAPAGSFHVYLEGLDIRTDRRLGAPAETEEQRKFLNEFGQQERLVRALYQRGIKKTSQRTPRLQSSVQRLAWAAGLGLQAPVPEIELARIAVQGVVADAIQENGVGVRGAYLRELGAAYIAATACLVVFTVLYYILTRAIGASTAFMVPGATLGLMDAALLSLAMGAWLIAAFRLQPDSPEVLTSLFTTTTSSWIRVILVFGFGFLGLLLFYKQVIVFSFGPNGSGSIASPFTTAQVFTKLSAAVLAGALLGLADAALPSAVIARSANLVAALAPR